MRRFSSRAALKTVMYWALRAGKLSPRVYLVSILFNPLCANLLLCSRLVSLRVRCSLVAFFYFLSLRWRSAFRRGLKPLGERINFSRGLVRVLLAAEVPPSYFFLCLTPVFM